MAALEGVWLVLVEARRACWSASDALVSDLGAGSPVVSNFENSSSYSCMIGAPSSYGWYVSATTTIIFKSPLFRICTCLFF